MGYLDAVVTLLENGANPNHTRPDGRNPIYIARKNGHVAVAAVLEEAAEKLSASRSALLLQQHGVFSSSAESTTYFATKVGPIAPNF